MKELRFSGSGGQGMILAGVIIAEAAVAEGREVVQTQSYGPESRGGASKAEVIIGDSPILYPKVTNPSLLLAMTQEALDKYGDDLTEDGILVVDCNYVQKIPSHFSNVYSIPITWYAKEKLGRELFANIVALGAVLRLTKVVSFNALENAVLNRVPKGTEALNRDALRIGYNSIFSFA
jgi:2-oxoglutarate ferredoxin oxidoreductase subunit gamma